MVLFVVLFSLLASGFGAAAALASFDNVGMLALEGIEGELGNNAGGIAVNISSGNVYVADGAHARMTVFNSHGVFIEAWGWGVANNSVKAFQHCVPGIAPCVTNGLGGEGVGQLDEPAGVAVDQTTGDVFSLDGARKSSAVQVFSASGSLLFSFGEVGGQGEPVTTGPDLIRTVSKSGIAFDQTTNDVYVVDRNNNVPSEGRVLVFRLVSGHYEYEKELFLGLHPEKVAVDAAGDVYVTAVEKRVYKFAVGNLVAPLWVHEEDKAVEGMTVNSVTGGVFYYTSQNHRFHELSAGTGEQVAEWPGVEIGGVKEVETQGLAFNPGLVWRECVKRVDGRFSDGTCSVEGSPNEFEVVEDRPAGVLYGVDPKLIEGLVFAEPPLLEPSVDSVWVSGVGTGSGVLHAVINPHGIDTHYVFQYGTEDCFVHACSKEVPFPSGGDVGSSGGNVSVSAPVGGLVPGTKYFYRVVASSHCRPLEPSEVCSVDFPAVAPASTFSTFPASSPGLSDGRVYELVSPPVKDGGDVFPLSPSTFNCNLCEPGVLKEHFPMQSTPSGDVMAYEGDPFTVAGGAVSENEYLSKRGVGGWLAPQDLSPVGASKDAIGGAGFKGFSADLSRGVFYEIGSSFEGAPAGYPDLYLKDTVGGGLQPLVTEATDNRTAKEFRLTFAGGSSDFDHLIFETDGVLSTESLVAAPAGSGGENDLYEWVNGSLRLVNILPDETAEPNAVFGSGGSVYSHAISDDGSRIFWTDLNNAHGHAGHVYVRVNDESTVEVSDSEGGTFLTASADGTRVLLSDGRIYDVSGMTSVEERDLTNGQHGFQGILGASEDLSTVYFVDTAVLAGAEKNDEGAEAVVGKDNLYVSQDGSVRFVAVLGSGDNATDLNHEQSDNMGDWVASSSERTAQATPDGGYLAFMSQAGLTKEASSSAGLFEVYEYNVSTNRLVCASCNPSGERPVGPSLLSAIHPGSGFMPQPLNVSVNGRVFFDSYDELSSQDTNGEFEDVYEYEPDGVGSCASQTGCVFLISSGQEETNSSFVNATPSGSDVFFTTRSRLVPQDQDDLMDLYDARVDGTPPSPLPSPPCEGEACKGSSSSPPSVLSVSLSSTIIGMGNIMPSPPSSPPSAPMRLTRAQKFTKALSACRKARTSRTKRLACEKRARKLYGPIKTKAKTGKVRASAHNKIGKR